MPPVQIEPIRSLRAEQVRDYLVRQGHDGRVIDWKYFDPAFAPGQERGYACLQDGRIVSFLGLLPVPALHHGRRLTAAWSCDWYKDPEVAGPLGLMLIRQGMKPYDRMYSLGGSEMTKAIMGRLARLTVPDAAVELYRPLRVGGALEMVQKATGYSGLSALSFIHSIPLPTALPSAGKKNFDLRETIPDSLEPLLLPSQISVANGPIYDVPYLRWLLERCPAINGGVCLASSAAGEPTAAVLFWRQTSDRRWWRICLLPDRHAPRSPELAGNSRRALARVLRYTLTHIRKEGGWMVSVLLSRLDRANLHLARRHAFVPSRVRRPLYILAQEPEAAPVEPAIFSYLDTDYAYRFPDPVS